MILSPLNFNDLYNTKNELFVLIRKNGNDYFEQVELTEARAITITNLFRVKKDINIFKWPLYSVKLKIETYDEP